MMMEYFERAREKQKDGKAKRGLMMKKLSPKGQRWLKGFHSFFACMWVGAAVVLSVKQFFVHPSSGGELYGITATMDFIDIYIIISSNINFT